MEAGTSVNNSRRLRPEGGTGREEAIMEGDGGVGPVAGLTETPRAPQRQSCLTVGCAIV